MSGLVRRNVREMSGYVPGEQPGTKDIIKLNTNENPYPPSAAVEKALKEFNTSDLRLYPDPVSSGLRNAIANMHNCSPAMVFAGNGSDEVLALCTRAFVEDGGVIGCLNPSYSLYPVLAEIRGVETRTIELDDDFKCNLAGIDPAGSGFDVKSALFFLANPNAPTGMMISPDEIAEFSRKFHGVVVVDEAYADFADANCLGLALQMQNVIVARTLSKSFSLAGLRIGYAVGPVPLIEALFKIKDSYNIDALSQKIALAAVSDREHMVLNACRIKKTRQRLSDYLAGRGYKVCASQSNFIWARPSGITAKELFEYLRKQRIFVRYFTGKRIDEYIRITVGTDKEIDTLMAVLDKLPGRTGV